MMAERRPVALVMGAPQFVAEPATLDAWAARAEPGTTCVYARTVRLTGSVADRARQMHERGMVQLAQGRDPEDRRLFSYRATRTGKPFAPPTPRTGPIRAEDAELLALIEDAAEAGARCPGNRALAARLGWKSEAAVVRAIARLRVSGAVRVWHADEGPSAGTLRVVEIVGSGARTAGPDAPGAGESE